ncbi:MAG: hypothetical protein HQK59_14970 [Deltaproteobacteria bacterium]|nr:hypothetical protein [Deltaproteobacteria bacterium]
MARKKNIKAASSIYLDQPEFDLWAAVLMQAVEDYKEGDLDARFYLTKDDDNTGSFNWICSMFDVEPDYIRNKLQLSKKERIEDRFPSSIKQSRRLYSLYRSRPQAAAAPAH